MPKKIGLDADVSSLIDLKAELFRKQNESLKQKTNNAGVNSLTSLYVKNKKPVFHDKEKFKANTNVSSSERSSKIKQLEEEMLEEEKQLKLSKERLMQKSRLYEKLSKNGQPTETDDEGNSIYLVNFEQKSKPSLNDSDDDDDVPGPSYSKEDLPANHEDEEWVTFTDSFGRSRQCMKKDLYKFQQEDHKKSRDIAAKTEQNNWSEQSELLSNDMKREIERRNWEESTEELSSVDIGPVHYQDVLRNETWEHGVSYYNFSTDEAERQKQMKSLDTLRIQTLQQRERNEKLKQKRKDMMKIRLEKVKERKKIKLENGDDELSNSSNEEKESIEGPQDVNLADIPLPENVTANAESKRASHVRPWDIGKSKFQPVTGLPLDPSKRKFNQTTWLEKQREERNDDFAPPTFYYS